MWPPFLFQTITSGFSRGAFGLNEATMCAAAADKRLLWHEVATDLLLSSLPSLLKGHYKRRQDLQEAGEEKKVTPPSWTSPCFGNAEKEKRLRRSKR